MLGPTGMAYPVSSIIKIRWLLAILVLMVSHELAAEMKNGFVLDDALVPQNEILHVGPGRDGTPVVDARRLDTRRSC